MPRNAMIKQLKKKQKIVLAAIDLYTDDRANFTVANLARTTRVKKNEIYRLFNSKGSILKYYYPLCVLRYRLMTEEIEDFAAWSFEEKLANFAYAMFDMLQEEREFVEEHFVEAVFHAPGTSKFQREVERLIREFLGEAAGIEWLAAVLGREYLRLIHFWLADESDDCERSMALVDKASAFIGEALRSRELVCKGADLAKYLMANDAINAPFAKVLLSQVLRWTR
jgi:AcrR family transcriptional regulator